MVESSGEYEKSISGASECRRGMVAMGDSLHDFRIE